MPSTSYNPNIQPYHLGYNPNHYQQPSLPIPPFHKLLPAPFNPSPAQALPSLNPPHPTLLPVQPIANPNHNKQPQLVQNI